MLEKGRQLQLVHPQTYYCHLNRIANAGRCPAPQEDGELSQRTAIQLDSEDDDLSLCEVLHGAQNIVYEARGDNPEVSYDENGKKKWLTIVVTNHREELGVEDMEVRKRIVYSEAESGLHLSRKTSIPHTNC